MSSIGIIQTGALNYDIAGREEQVTGKGQRIPPLAFEEISTEAKQLLLDLGKSLGTDIRAAREAQIVEEHHRTGGTKLPGPSHFPPTIATMLRHPNLYRRQLELSIQLFGGGTISARERELAVLRVAWLCRAPNEWGEHVEVAKLCGVSSEEIERVTLGSSAAAWNDHERALLRAVEELLGDQSISDETWSTLACSWNDQQLIELPVLVGVYHLMALQQNSLRVRLPDHNKGLLQR